VAVTGATGFVGGHTVAALIAAGHDVRALVRDRRRLEAVAQGLGFDVPDTVVGSMTDSSAVVDVLDGCDAVVHAAAVVTLDRRRADQMATENPAATALVAGRAAALGLDPIVCVSSSSALFAPGAGPLRGDLPVATPGDAYAVSKAASEVQARRLQAEGAPVVITYPSGIIGPAAGSALGETSAGMARFLSTRCVPTRRASLSLIDVRDLGALHTALVERPTGHRRVMCGGHHVSMADLADAYERVTGRRCVVLPMPPAALRGLGRGVDLLRRVVPVPGPMTAEGMTLITRWDGTHDADLPELGSALRPLDDTLADSLRAWHAAGLLSARQIGRVATR
jgi:nucleoside-diphosphate-sugar epimerase